MFGWKNKKDKQNEMLIDILSKAKTNDETIINEHYKKSAKDLEDLLRRKQTSWDKERANYAQEMGKLKNELQSYKNKMSNLKAAIDTAFCFDEKGEKK